MTADQLDQLRSQIQTSLDDIRLAKTNIREQLLQSANARITLAQDKLDHAKGEVDLSTALELHQRNLKAEDNLLGALKRIQDEVFGLCLRCEDEISLGRLKACPTTLRCLKCQTQHEHTLTAKKYPTWSVVSGAFAKSISFQNMNMENL